MLRPSRSTRERQQLILGIVLWLAIFLAGIFCLWWGFFAPTPESFQPAPTSTVAPTRTSTPIGGLIPLATATPSSGGESRPTVPLSQETFGYGIAVHAVVGDPNYTMDVVKSLGLGWVKQQLRWDLVEPSPGQYNWGMYDGVVDAANQRGLRVMLSVVHAPEWSHPSYRDDNPEGAPPDDLALFADFLGRLVDRYRGRIHAIEVWNEQNLDREWDTAEGVKPVRYVEMLRLAYQAIKSRDPNLMVISGALSPVGATATDPKNPNRIIYMDDFQYYQEMIASGFLSYADCVGVHHNGYNIPPDIAWDDKTYQDPAAKFRAFWDNPHPSWSFRSTLWRYRDAISGMKPLCVTEFGWASSEGFGPPPPGFEFALDNTLQEQAQYIVRAYQLMREWGFVRLAFLWNLDYIQKTGLPPEKDPYGPYSIIDPRGAPRPAFDAIRGMPKP